MKPKQVIIIHNSHKKVLEGTITKKTTIGAYVRLKDEEHPEWFPYNSPNIRILGHESSTP
jgi:hypothetical protein